MNPHIVWFREDLRLRDNPALSHAVESGKPLLLIYLYTPDEEKPWEPREGVRFWLYYALQDLEREIKERGGKLHFFQGKKAAILLERLLKETKADSLSFNISCNPLLLQRDRALFDSMKKRGVEILPFYGNLLIDPKEILEVHRKPYTVFTPFYKCLTKCGVEKPLPAPKKIDFYSKKISSSSLDDLSIYPKSSWIQQLEDYWKVGTKQIPKKLDAFARKVSSYKKNRDFPALEGTSKLSPSLHVGEVSPRELWDTFSQSESFQREVAWREFAKHLLLFFPETIEKPLREEFQRFPWKKDATALKKWKEGKTGYPFIDAGMRELTSIGWMHNRARMAVASFLVKDLHIHWLEGAKWFWEKLVDADLANNTLGWQWSAGCGADAAPFFRIFNPVTQGKKFDPEGEYIRTYLPELAKLPKEVIHEPWKASDEILHAAGVTLGKTYPYPIVDHAEMRKKSLDIFQRLIKK